jgi:hypothetical protein
MGDGTYSWSEAENFDWHHEADPIVAFLVLRKTEKIEVPVAAKVIAE